MFPLRNWVTRYKKGGEGEEDEIKRRYKLEKKKEYRKEESFYKNCKTFWSSFEVLNAVV